MRNQKTQPLEGFDQSKTTASEHCIHPAYHHQHWEYLARTSVGPWDWGIGTLNPTASLCAGIVPKDSQKRVRAAKASPYQTGSWKMRLPAKSLQHALLERINAAAEFDNKLCWWVTNWLRVLWSNHSGVTSCFIWTQKHGSTTNRASNPILDPALFTYYTEKLQCGKKNNSKQFISIEQWMNLQEESSSSTFANSSNFSTFLLKTWSYKSVTVKSQVKPFSSHITGTSQGWLCSAFPSPPPSHSPKPFSLLDRLECLCSAFPSERDDLVRKAAVLIFPALLIN